MFKMRTLLIFTLVNTSGPHRVSWRVDRTRDARVLWSDRLIRVTWTQNTRVQLTVVVTACNRIQFISIYSNIVLTRFTMLTIMVTLFVTLTHMTLYYRHFCHTMVIKRTKQESDIERKWNYQSWEILIFNFHQNNLFAFIAAHLNTVMQWQDNTISCWISVQWVPLSHIYDIPDPLNQSCCKSQMDESCLLDTFHGTHFVNCPFLKILSFYLFDR